MKQNKIVWVTLIQLIWLKESHPSNSTQIVPIRGSELKIADDGTSTPPPLRSTNDVTVNPTDRPGNDTTTSAVAGNVSGLDNTSTSHLSTVLSWNDTVKTNYKVMSEAVASQESPFRLESAGAIAAGVFLVSAVVGYFSCVGYRRFMQKKYGNSQILAGEDVYDTSDLRYFEI